MANATGGSASFRRLVRVLLPADFREDHEDDMVGVFADLLAEARVTGGPRAAASVWLREIGGLVKLSWRLRRGGSAVVTGDRWNFAIVSWIDVKLGLRMLVKQPGLTIVAVFSLAVGIPIGLAPGHVANALTAPLPVVDADRVQVVRNRNLETGGEADIPLRDFVRWRDELTSFEALAATTRRASYNIISADGRAAPMKGAVLTAAAFDILRIAPHLGRTLVPGDEEPGAPDVVVVGHDFWTSRLNGDSDVIGQVVRIAGVQHSVVGVMPEGFLFPYQSQLWMPLRTEELVDARGQRADYLVFGRLADAVSIAEAQAEVATAGARLAMDAPDIYARLRPQVVPFAMGFFGLPLGGFQAVLPFRVLQLAALLVLVIACANVGMLTFTRTTTRAGELAVRTALGASRARVISQLFTEALIFAVVAAGVGLLIGQYASVEFDVLIGMLPYWVDFGVTRETALWAISLAVLSAGVVGVIPALKVTGRHVQQNVQRARAGRSGVRFGGMSSALIIADVALAVATVAVTVGLSDRITAIDDQMPIDASQYLAASLTIPGVEAIVDMDPSERVDFQLRIGETQRAVVQRLEAEPGVGRVAVAGTLPGMDHLRRIVEVDGFVSPEPLGIALRAWTAQVDVDFFDAFEQPVLSGRGFSLNDLGEPRNVVIVNTGFVRRVLGGRNAIGQRVRYAVPDGEEAGAWFEVVGVVGPLGMSPGEAGMEAGLYHPLAPGELNRVQLAIYTGGQPEAFTPRLREIAGEADATAIISDPVALDEVFSFSRLTMTWVKRGALTLVGVLLSLSISGVYALMSFNVGERTREIGIRAALGARRGSIVLTIARRSLLQLGIGLALGMPIAWRVFFGIKRDLGRLPTHSPVVLAVGVAVGVMVLIALLACAVPTRRALKIMPTEALQ